MKINTANQAVEIHLKTRNGKVEICFANPKGWLWKEDSMSDVGYNFVRHEFEIGFKNRFFFRIPCRGGKPLKEGTNMYEKELTRARKICTEVIAKLGIF